jgi:acetolactate synthase I/II/III large subunit
MTSLPESDNLTGGQVVVAMLESLGIAHVFGIPGGQTLAITDALIDSEKIRFVTTRHECAAACMADAVGRLTGRPGVCLATTGPGATNLLTGVGGAMRDSSPVIVLTCNNFSWDLGRDDAQAADHVSIFQPLTKWTKLVTRPSMIDQALIEAYLRACSGCPGPVLVDLTRDAVEGTVPRSEVKIPANLGQELEHTLGSRSSGDPGQVAAMADALAKAQAPVIWLGNGARLSGAGAAAMELARRLDAGIVTTFNGIGVVPTGDAHVFGPLSRMGTALSSRVMRDADVLLAVGNSLNGPSTGRWSIQLPTKIFQVDTDAGQFGRAYARQTTGVHGDARAVLEQLVAALPARLDGDLAEARAKRIELLRSAKQKWHNDAVAAQGRMGAIDPTHVVDVVRSATPDDTLLIVDAGNPGIWTHLWDIRAPNTYLKPVGFGNMGFALPAAIGAKLTNPERAVVALIGDGSLGMTLAELETVVREDVPITIVLLNDLGYGNIRQEQEMKYGKRLIGVDFGDVDYVAIARGFGIESASVTDPGDVRDAVEIALKSGGAYLVDIRIDPELSVWRHPLFQAFDTEA